MGMILRIASSRIVGQGDIVGRSGYFSLNLSANSVMRGRLDARRTLKSLVADLRLFFDFKFKAKYLAFISCLLEKPDLSVKTALKSIFRKSQVRSISEKFGLNLNAQIVCLSPSQWLNCFLEMLEVVPEKFHPS